MYCFRCGQQLPTKVINCPACDTPQKRRQRRRHRLILGLFIFLTGAFVGSLFDSLIFKGRTWEHSIFDFYGNRKSDTSVESASQPRQVDFSPVQELPPQSSSGPQPALNQSAKYLSKPPVDMPSIDLPAGDPRTIKHPQSGDGFLAEAATASLVPPTALSASSTAAASTTLSVSDATSLEAIETDQKRAIPDGNLTFEKNEGVEEGPGSNYHGSLSSDGKVLIFSSNRPAGGVDNRYQCYIKELGKTSGSARLFPWKGNVWTPEFSPDGKMVVFSSDSDKKEHVFIYDFLSQQIKKLTDGDSKNMMPTFSPDGKYIAFTSDRKGHNNIWLIGTDGSGLIQITTGANDDREPRWWPDGKSVIFTRIIEKLKISNIMKVPLDPEGPPKPLVDTKSRNWLADPCPDGRWLAYVKSDGPDGSGNSIRIRRLDSGKEFSINPLKGGEYYRPIWTQDGDAIVYHADRQNKKNLFLGRFVRTPID